MNFTIPVSLMALVAFIACLISLTVLTVTDHSVPDGIESAMLLALGGVLGTAVAVKTTPPNG